MISVLAYVRSNQATGKFSRQTMLLALVYALCGFAVPVMAQDQGWPRSIEDKGNEVVTFQPQIDEWQDHKFVQARPALAMTRDLKARRSIFPRVRCWS